MTRITIVGAGLMGSATAYPLADNGHDVRLVGTHLDGEIIRECKGRRYHPRLKRMLPAGVIAYYIEELEQALEGAEIIVSGVNSHGVHWIGKTLAPYLKPGQMIIAVTKGLELNEQGVLTILPDVLRSELPEAIRQQVALGAIGGPCIAGELAGKRHSLVVFGSRDAQAVERLAATFRTSYYHVWTTTHLEALEYCAALKNAYTMGVGLAAGILENTGGIDSAEAGMHNLAAGLFGAATTEMDRLLQIAGLERSFAYSLPGAGDMYVTCVGGRTIRLGTLLGKGHSYRAAREIMAGETLEGAQIVTVMSQALPRLVQQGMLGAEELPFMRALIAIVVHGKAVHLPLEEFFGGAGRL